VIDEEVFFGASEVEVQDTNEETRYMIAIGKDIFIIIVVR
jgi:hypothetical protein